MIKTEKVVYSVIREEHMIHNDFFLRCLEFPEGSKPQRLTMTCLAGSKALYEVHYEKEEIEKRFQYSKEEVARYRTSSLERILGLSYRPENGFFHEYFSFFSSEAAEELLIRAECADRALEKHVRIFPYESRNVYRFPMEGTLLVTDTYSSINSHRWCRNSEFAFDVGAFDETLEKVTIEGRTVLAACDGIVEEVFDGLDDTEDSTDLEAVEKQFGEHARIDGNHVLIRHKDRELSLYAHLAKGSISVKMGETVQAGQQIGKVGSSGSSFLPHLHFHVMREGIHGPGVPVRFENLKTILGEPCGLEDTVNLVRVVH